MVKTINKNNVLITPFIASKGCNLYGAQTDDLLMIEESPTTASVPIAFEFVDYGNGMLAPTISRACNIALEQQTLDAVIYEEGISGSGLFYPEREDQNINGSYKRLVFNQIKQAFYNDYRDPMKLFGLENIDIDLSGTRRFIAERIRVYTVPRSIFGEKILEGSIQLQDNALDDEYLIVDDSKGNLLAGTNLFSRYQAIRPFSNYFASGSTNIDCPPPEKIITTTTTTTTTTAAPTTTTTTTTTTPGPTTTTTTTTPAPTTTTTTTTTTTPVPTTTTTTTTTTLAPTTTTTTTTTLAPTTTTTTPAPITTTTTPAPPITTTTTTVLPPTTTTTTSTTPANCVDCPVEIFPDTLINVIHYSGKHPGCTPETNCDASNCNLQTVCNAVYRMEEGDSYCVSATPWSVCQYDNHYDACWVPVLDYYTLYCGYAFSRVETKCLNPDQCDTTMLITRIPAI